MAIEHEQFDYDDNGTTLKGFVAYEKSAGKRPCVLVAHAWGGRGEFENEKAVLLAEMGYVGFAIDVYGDGTTGSGPDENSKLMQPFLDDRALLQRRLNCAVDAARTHDAVDANQIAAIGYCFGGMAVLDLARTGADVAGVVSFHGLFIPPGNTEGNTIKAKVLVLHGWDDPMAQPEAVVGLAAELTAAKADWQIHGYGNTAHSFTNPEANDPNLGAFYNSDADRRSWVSNTHFLEELFA